MVQKILTLQTNNWWGLGYAKSRQIILVEHTFHLSVYVSLRATRCLVQLHADVALELIKFRENRNYRDLKSHPGQPNSSNKSSLDLPF